MEPGVSHTALDRGGQERFQTLRQELGVTTFGINLMGLDPGARSRIHRHQRQEEVYVVLEGELTLETEDGTTAFGPDSVVRVAPDVRRQLHNRGDERLLMLALGGAQPHEGRDGEAFLSWDDPEPRAPRDVPLPD